MIIGARTGAWAKSGSPTPAYGGLCFTAEADDSSVQLTAVGSAPVVTLVKSFDGVNWEAYAVGEVIELPSVGDFVYLAAGEGGNETFGSVSARRHNKFVINGLVAASGDITSLRRFDLEQTPLASYCYFGIFRGCTGLKSAPELPATTLNNFCYGYMFRGCTGLTIAPELPATTLASSCYYSIFEGCTNLSLIKVRFTAWEEQTSGWVSNVKSTGTFYKPTALPEEYGKDKIPTGWAVVNIY